MPSKKEENQSSDHPQHPESEPEYFDDCPICRAMKEGRTSSKDMRQAFKEAKEQGAVVGGEWFEKD